jgi:hypothetical protein
VAARIGAGRLGLAQPGPPFVQFPFPLARQISPGKNAMCPRTSAAFTVPVVPVGFAVMCQLASTCSAFYAVSLRRLAHLLSGFLHTSPHELALAFG